MATKKEVLQEKVKKLAAEWKVLDKAAAKACAAADKVEVQLYKVQDRLSALECSL